MKKNLRLLCLGLAAATITCGFAQEDKTSLLKNADMEQGVKGWSFDGVDVVGKNTKNPSTQIGFHGMNKGVQEAWHSSASNPLGDSYVMQRLSNLPAGTYVFGAYAAAAKQMNRMDICERETKDGNTTHVLVDGKHQYSEYWSNRDSINGVVLFANNATVRVATDNPDLSAAGQFFGHSSKFNVAVTLSDADEKKGYLDLGMRVTETNANYIVWDNATLYYFGNMSEAAALDAMAEIDMNKAAAIADTLKGYKMNVDSLSALTAAIAAAKANVTTAATLWDDSKAIHEAAALARKSITDYANLKKNIESAKLLTDPSIEWSQEFTPDFVALLEEVIAASEEAYDAAELDRAGLTALRKELNWSAGDVHVDSVYRAWFYLADYNLTEAAGKVNQPGGITQVQYDELKALEGEVADTVAVYEIDAELPMEDRTINPNNLLPYIAKIYNAIKKVEDNPISTEYTKMPIQFNQAENGWIEGAEWFDESKKIMGYTSPMYRFQGKIQNFRITVKKNKNNAAHFCLSKLEFFDGNGAKIELTSDNLTTNADQNTTGDADGGGIDALFDEDNNSYFHSSWQNGPSEAHYLEVNLPNGGYDAFSFRMLSRSNSNGWDQSHTFPGEMVISTPAPKRDALEALLNEAKNMNVYSIPEVGFYTGDFSYLTDEIAKAEAALATWPTEDECDQLRKDLQKQIQKFKDPAVDKSIYLPEAGVAYRIVSGFPGYYDKQHVEKALTINAADTTLWWGNVDAADAMQLFNFEPINPDENGLPSVEIETGENEDGTTWESIKYLYTIKNVGNGLYVDSTFKNNQLHLVEQALDTVRLVSLGRGQWNIVVKGSTLHAGDHNSGNPSESKGAYGGIAGIGSGIVSYGGGIDGASAWFIREYPTLPTPVAVSGAQFKSNCIHFQAANTITLTADKACGFANLALYDLYGEEIEVAEVVVEGNKATITTPKNIVGCAFAFANNEGVTSVSFNAIEFTAAIELLQAAYDAAVAVAPVQGTEVMQYADLSGYNAALAEAEAMIEAGAADDAAIQAMIEQLEAAVAALVPNMPVEGKYYYIYSGLDKFENNHGYLMAMYTKESKVFWAQENECEWNRYWQFEQATEAELTALQVKDATIPAYYIKNVSNGMYIGKAEGKSTQIEMVASKSSTVPYTITSLQQGTLVAIAGANDASNRLHGAGHGEGKNKNGTIVYWNSGLGTASIWTIAEAQLDLTDIDFTEVETEKAVVKGTFDLFGRRVAAPTAPGIYIIDGKKRYIK